MRKVLNWKVTESNYRMFGFSETEMEVARLFIYLQSPAAAPIAHAAYQQAGSIKHALWRMRRKCGVGSNVEMYQSLTTPPQYQSFKEAA